MISLLLVAQLYNYHGWVCSKRLKVCAPIEWFMLNSEITFSRTYLASINYTSGINYNNNMEINMFKLKELNILSFLVCRALDSEKISQGTRNRLTKIYSKLEKEYLAAIYNTTGLLYQRVIPEKQSKTTKKVIKTAKNGVKSSKNKGKQGRRAKAS